MEPRLPPQQRPSSMQTLQECGSSSHTNMKIPPTMLFLTEDILVQTFSSISDLLSDKQMHTQADMFYSFTCKFIFGHTGPSWMLMGFPQL